MLLNLLSEIGATEQYFPLKSLEYVETIINKCEQSPYSVQEILGEVLPLVQTITHDECINNIDNGRSIVVASNNSNTAINTIMPKDIELPYKNSPFDLRLLQLPSEIVHKLEQGKTTETIVSSDDASENSSDSTFPAKLGFN